MLTVATMALNNGYCMLLRQYLQGLNIQLNMQDKNCSKHIMPLVSINIGNQNSEKSFAILMKKYPNTVYLKISSIFQGLVVQQSSKIVIDLVKLLQNLIESVNVYSMPLIERLVWVLLKNVKSMDLKTLEIERTIKKHL